MNINSNHVIGFAAGIVVSAGGYYLYKKNQSRVDGWLREQGINVPGRTSTAPEAMSLKDFHQIAFYKLGKTVQNG